jgi:hypothetical protein
VIDRAFEANRHVDLQRSIIDQEKALIARL